MPTLMPSDTRDVLRDHAGEFESRSLFMDRFAQPGAEKEDRKTWFSDFIRKPPAVIARPDLAAGTNHRPLYAQLQSRLMVNMAGGVMENAGICLDRFGLPYIPGSAVKGCARRMAIQSLLEAREAGEDALKLASLLADLALVFGWGEQDWTNKKKDGRFTSDFAYAIGDGAWDEVCIAARKLLPEADHFAGVVSFLPARAMEATGAKLPSRVPALGSLDLDVLTCHHPDYYGQKKDGRGNLKMPVALDTEDPIPVLFPAVASGHAFAFPLLPLRSCTAAQLRQAREWLAEGLAGFGLGAKTAAGYGWFDSSSEINELISAWLIESEAAKARAAAALKQEALEKAKQEEITKKKKALAEQLAALSPDEQEDYKFAQFSDEQFRSILESYAKRTGDEQKAIVRALRLEPVAPGTRRAFWEDLKGKSQKKGGRYAQTEQAIRQLSKQMYPGKEGKMP